MLTNLYPNSQEPNRGIFTAQLVAELKRICDIRVLSPLPWFPKMDIFKKYERWYKFALVPKDSNYNGIQVSYPKYIVIPKIFGFLHSMFMFFSIVFKLLRIHRHKKIDVLNAQWVFPDGVAAVLAAKILRIPVVVSALGCDINLYSSKAYKLRRIQIIHALKRAEQTVTVSLLQKNRVASDLGIREEKLNVILNGVDQDLFNIKDRDDSIKKCSLEAGMKYVLYVGRLSEEKGIMNLINAVSLIKKDGKSSNFKVLIIGTGELLEESLQKIDSLGLGNEFSFCGEKNHKDVTDWLGACDLLCLPSKREGCPNVVLEALSSGRPVISTRVGSVPELINENNGFLAEPENERELADALSLGLSREWDAEVIRKSVAEYTWKGTAYQYMKIYEKAISLSKNGRNN